MWKFDRTRLIALRESQGLTQVEFARKIGGIYKQPISDWENGKITPSTKMLVRIANVFGIVPAFFYIREADSTETIKEVEDATT